MPYVFEAYPEGMTAAEKSVIDKKRRFNVSQAEKAIKENATEIVASGDVTDDQIAAIQEALNFLNAKRPRAARKGAVTKTAKVTREEALLNLFNDPDNLDANGSIDELAMFVKTKMGRHEVLTGLKKALDFAVPASRVWVAFNSEAGVYTLEGRGENPPAGWKGKLPAPKLVEDESALGPE